MSRRTARRAATSLGLAAILIAAAATPALAAPSFAIELERDQETVSHSDERIDYTVTVRNEAEAAAPVGEGDALVCLGTDDGTGQPKNWLPNTAETEVKDFDFEWRRNGAVIAGAESQVYDLTADDAGKAVQCVVTGTNVHAAAAFAALPALEPPPPAIPPPKSLNRTAAGSRPSVTGTGLAKRTCNTGSMNWSIVATASTTSGSSTLTAVATAKGTGALSVGSKVVSGVTTTAGTFRVGQTVSGAGIPAATTIETIAGNTLELSAAATETKPASNALSAGAQPFAVGETIVGKGIPAGTTVTAVSDQTLTLSASATATATGVAVSSVATGTWSYRWLRDGEPIAGAEASEYTPVEAEDKDTVLQCEVIGANAGGALVGISNGSPVNVAVPASQFPSLSTAQTPEMLANSPVGTVTLELELPGGEETYAFDTEGSGWSCDPMPAVGGQPARVVCTRSGTQAFLAPEAAYPALTVVTALGADAPDTAVATATVHGGGSPAATAVDEFVFADPIPFGVTEFEARLRDAGGNDYTQAGGHPFDGVGRFVLAQRRNLVEGAFSKNFPIEPVKQVIVDIPPGVVGNALAVPELCPTLEDVEQATCPPGSIVGGVSAKFSDLLIDPVIYAIEPEFGTPAQFAFADPTDAIYTFSARLRPDDGYAVSLELSSAPVVDLLEATATLCNFGGREHPTLEDLFDGCKQKDDADANPKPLFTNPTRCGKPAPVTRARVDSWQNPGVFVEAEPFVNAEITGCEAVDFEPEMEFEPSSSRADSPTGLDVELTMPTDGLEDPDGISQAHLKRARVVFPEGMAVNASAGHGLAACSPAQVGIDAETGVPDGEPAACPDSSKIGTVEIETPVIEDTLAGDVFIARQGAVDGATVGFYLVFESPKNGIVVKMPARVDFDRHSGRLVATVDSSPQQPFSAVRLHFPGGSRATLLTPPKCGTYEISAELSPWSAQDPDNPTAAEIVSQTSSFAVTEGPNGGPCPSGALDPKLEAGTVDPVAGERSPFVLRLHREDGTQRFSSLSLDAPPGLTVYLKGVPYCPDAALAGISSALGTGQREIDNPSCPLASRIGTVVAGAGAGPSPFFVRTGRAYLAGPYKGAPLSIAVVVPAVAGPLDLGTVVVRNALRIDSETAQVSVVSDPIPTILHGILLGVRDVRVAIDRPGFTLNPTSCEEKSVAATVGGDAGGTAKVANRFQVGGCGELDFGPKVFTRLFGGTKRGAYPRLRTVLMAPEGEANLARLSLALPRSEFLEQAHIRTICTRVQFAADRCPKGATYGYAKVFSPLLDYPLRGPAILRSSDNELPDLVLALRGPAHQPVAVDVVARIDSVRRGIRATVEAAPDAPVSKAVVTMQGGRKGLLVNSRDVCRRPSRVIVQMSGQNGKRSSGRPVLRNSRCRRQRRTKERGPRANRTSPAEKKNNQ